ncbi:MAG TPA: glycosyltransferase family 1 protein [Patescibacteria group bacterium]|nr:glycosyltransferase family 1 protein [Patescibacteria group bacterium]
MKIGLDLRMTAGGSGISRYIEELSHAILSKDRGNQYVLFFRNAKQTEDYKKYNQKIVICDIAHYSFAEQFKFPSILRKENLDLVHFPHFNVPIFYNRPFVVTIHDLTHTRFPGRKKSHILHRMAYNMVLAAAIKKSRRIIAVSESTKKEILEYFGVEPDKITVVYEGVNPKYHLLDKDLAVAEVNNRFKIAKPYILYVGVFRRYKNLPNLARAFDMLRDEGVDAELVLAGDFDPYYPEIKQQILASKHAGEIKILGRVSDEDLIFLYNGCSLFVLPSLSEGFGLTAIEAAATGVPIAASDIPTLREILGHAAEYFDPTNVENMVDVILGVLHNESRGEELANLVLKRAAQFTWSKAAEGSTEVYNSAIDGK